MFKFEKILFLIIFISINLNSQIIKKESEIEFETSIQFFLLNEKLHLWGGGTLQIYDDMKLKEKKSILKRGEGPGDFRVIQNIYYHQNKYYFWDRLLQRMTIFSDNWSKQKIKKIKLPSLVSAFIGKIDNILLFKWNSFPDYKNKRTIINKIGFIEPNKEKVFVEMEGDLLKGETVNLDRPSLLYSLKGKTLYYADNREYKIYSINFIEKTIEKKLFIKNSAKTVKWDENITNLEWKIVKKPSRIKKKNYPENVPPLFYIAASEDLLIVVTNEKIDRSIAKIDIYYKGKYKGSADIPLLYKQFFVIPPFQNYPPDICLNGAKKFLYTFHYIYDEDVYKLVKWKIDLNNL